MSAPTAAPPAPDRLVSGHLHQVDVVRLLTFGSVIAVHVIAATTPAQSEPARGVLMLLHFTRETFFVITGFVLVHTYLRRPLAAGTFWRRRYLLIGVPYLAWSGVYWAEHVVRERDGGRLTASGLRTLGYQLLTGTAEYHLYFLLVSMQVYLVFPLLLRLIRATAGRPWHVLGLSGALQLVLFWVLHDLHTNLHGSAEEVLTSYQLYVIAGALAAAHLAALQAWLLAHRRLVAVAVAVGALVTEGVYLVQVGFGTSPSTASEVLQPVMVFWTLVITAGLLVLGVTYARRRRPGPLAAAVQGASRISFGVFLVHPLVITVLTTTWPGRLIGRVPAPASQVLLWTATVAISLAVAWIAARSPLALPLTGRRYSRAPRAPRTRGPEKETP